MMKNKRKDTEPYCYIRTYDTTMNPQELLQAYGLTQGKYLYVGSSKLKINERNSRWKSHIVAGYCVDKNVLDFIKKYKKFLMEQSDMSTKEIDNELFNSIEKVSRHNTIENAKTFENDLIGNYQIIQELNDIEPYSVKIFILNSRGSSVKIKENKIKLKKKLFLD